jgi:hypothetical protein
MEDHIRKHSLQELDGQDWGEPNYASHLVTEYHRLRRVALETMTVGDLRLLIVQKDYLEYLLTLAFEHFLNEPWVAGDYYEGDLLHAVLSVPESFWYVHPELKRTCDQVVQSALLQAPSAEPEDAELYDERVLQQLRQWPGTLDLPAR